MNERETPITDTSFDAYYRGLCGLADLRQKMEHLELCSDLWYKRQDDMEKAGAEQARLADENREWALKAERERDEALAKLSTVYRWIEKNNGDGFIDSQTHVQNLQRISDYWYDRLDNMRCERDEARKALSGRTVSCSQCNEATKQIAAMREVIKEAHEAIKAVPVEYDSRFFRAGRWSEKALAKLQPFLA